eukprot:Sdes_comp15382_c0_seq1m4261
MQQKVMTSIWGKLGRKKIPNLGSDQEGENLLQCLGKLDLIAYGVGNTFVFVLIGNIARDYAGPSVVLSYLFAGFAACLSGLCFAEFSAKHPASGSAYSYAYATMGEFMAWMIGWNITLEYGISAAAVSSSFSGYFFSLLSSLGATSQPPWLTPTYIPGTHEMLILNVLPVLLIGGCFLILLKGIKNFRKFNNIVTAFNILLILFFVILGSFYIDPANYSNFFPYGFKGTLSGAARAFFAYVGFDTVSSLSAESLHPHTDVPFALMATLVIVTFLYCSLGFVLTGMQNYSLLDPDSTLTVAFQYHSNSWAAILIGFGSLSCLAVVTLCSLLGQPRIYFTMARDGLLPASFTKLNANKVPVLATLTTCIVAALLALFFDLKMLGDMISAGILIAYSVVCAGVLLLRMNERAESFQATPFRKITYHHYRFWAILSFLCGSFFTFLVLHLTNIPIIDLCFCSLFTVLLPASITLYFYYSPLGKSSLCSSSSTLSLAPPSPLATLSHDLAFKNSSSPPNQFFKAPCLPFLPLLAIIINSFLFASLNTQSFFNISIWTLIGFIIYFTYGFRHSLLNLNSPPFHLLQEECPLESSIQVELPKVNSQETSLTTLS